MYNFYRSANPIRGFIALAMGILFLSGSVTDAKVTVKWNSRQDLFSIRAKDETVRNVFEYIEKNSNYIFIYEEAVESRLSTTVDVSLEGQDIESILKTVCSQTGLEYLISGRQIAVWLEGGISPIDPDTSFAVSGKVTDINGEPLIGASVFIKGTETGVVTNLDGRYSITAHHGDVLVFSYIGYQAKEMTASGKDTADIVLTPDSRLLNESVVVGYGVQKKINLTGAVDVVDSEELVGRSASNTSSLLVGIVPNLNVTQSNGRPGQGASLNIRGINSISSSTGPLVLVDGIEGNIDNVNPNDIESISVLKDASSSAVYGARAAYGVILITTKSGSDGKAHVSYNGRFSFSTTTTSTDFETRGYYSAAIADMFFSTYQGSPYTAYNAEDYYELWIRRNDKVENPERPWVMVKDGQYKHYANFDWYHYLFDDTRPTWEHDISIYGGNDKLNYRISGGLYDGKGVLNVGSGDDYKRWNFRSKISAQITPWLKISNNTSFAYNRYNFNSHGAVARVFSNSQTNALASFMPYNPDGTAVWELPGCINSSYQVTNGVNVILRHDKDYNQDSNNVFGTIFEAVLTPVRHFSITANYSYTQSEYIFVNRTVPVPYSETPGVVEIRTDITDKLTESRQKSRYHAANAFANYDNTFSGHHIGITAGVNYETRFYNDLSASRNELLSEDMNDFDLAKGEEMSIGGGKNRYALFGIFYRVNYDYRERYLLEISGRYDGSSRFAPGHRFGFFPSVSAGWRIDQEKFFAPARKYVSNMKLRLSYGMLGNQQIGYYDYIQTINSGSSISYAFGESNRATGATVSAPNASDLTWETVTTMNAGIDLGFFNNRLNFSADAYIRDTEGMLMASQDLPSVYGASVPKSNAASLRSKGWELQLSWRDNFILADRPFNYYVSATLADYISHVTYYNNENKTIGTPYTGQRLGEMWGYVVDGYFISDEEAAAYPVNQNYVNNMINACAKDPGVHAGDLKFVDMDGDGKISPTLSANDIKDQVVIGNSLPRYTYSLGLGGDWMGFDLSVLFQGVGYQNWYPGSNACLFWGPYARPFQSFVPTDFLSKVWTPENPDAYFPRPRGYVAFAGEGGARELTVVNTKYLQNVGYLRLKSLVLGYSLPQKWMDKAKIEKIRVYFSGENLFTVSPLETRYIDPYIAGSSTSWSTGNTDANGYPLNRTFSFGVDITF